MGRAEILENLKDGLYRVSYKYGTAAIVDEIAYLDGLIDELAKGIVKLTDEIATLTTQFNALYANVQVILSEPGPMTDDRKKRLNAALAALNTVGLQLKQAESAKSTSEAQRTAAIEKSLALSALPEDEERQMWMADCSTEIQPTGSDIATIEIAGEAHGDNEALLYPANNQAPVTFDEAKHGERQHALALSPSGCFAAWSLFPGWQKYKPLYRAGKITAAVDNDFYTVELVAPLVSSERGIAIPPSDPMLDGGQGKETHARVPVRYLDCHAAAFTIGDHVIIEYTSQHAKQPVIIGFRDHPQPCTPRIALAAGITEKAASVTEGGLAVVRDNAWKFRSQPGVLCGNCDWQGALGQLSWWGPMGRELLVLPETPGYQSSPLIYRQGAVFAEAPGLVMGAALTYGRFVGDGDGDSVFLVAVTRDSLREVFWKKKVTGGDWSAQGELKYGAGDNPPTGSVVHVGLGAWKFNHRGNEAVATKEIVTNTNIDKTRTSRPYLVAFRGNGAALSDITREEGPSFLAGSEVPALGSTIVLDAYHSDWYVDFRGNDLVRMSRRFYVKISTTESGTTWQEDTRLEYGLDGLSYLLVDFHDPGSPFGIPGAGTSVAMDFLSINVRDHAILLHDDQNAKNFISGESGITAFVNKILLSTRKGRTEIETLPGKTLGIFNLGPFGQQLSVATVARGGDVSAAIRAQLVLYNSSFESFPTNYNWSFPKSGAGLLPSYSWDHVGIV